MAVALAVSSMANATPVSHRQNLLLGINNNMTSTAVSIVHTLNHGDLNERLVNAQLVAIQNPQMFKAVTTMTLLIEMKIRNHLLKQQNHLLALINQKMERSFKKRHHKTGLKHLNLNNTGDIST